MELFNFAENPKLSNEKLKIDEFHSNNYCLFVVSTSNTNCDMKMLLNVKTLFHKMLPKMPKEYILRQVLDKKHCSLVLTGSDETDIIGAVCYRPAYDLCLVEIVFLAINSSNHVSGYGTFLMNCLKETAKLQFAEYLAGPERNILSCKTLKINTLDIFHSDQDAESDRPKHFKVSDRYTSDKSLYLLTYADNSAIGFFKKQGFSQKPVSTNWVGFIKDYDGGTLVECKIHRDINYFDQKALISRLGSRFLNKMKDLNSFHIIREHNDPDIQDAIDTQLPDRTQGEFLKDFLYFLICDLESNPSAWPFVEPVSAKDVPEYYDVILMPMDLSKILDRFHKSGYSTVNQFIQDVLLMVNNCYTFNRKDTQYYKCAENIESRFLSQIKKYRNTIEMWGYRIDYDAP